jgi:hypothetical protein
MRRTVPTLFIALTALAGAGCDSADLAELLRALGRHHDPPGDPAARRPISLDLPAGTHLFYTPVRGKRPSATLASPAFSTIARGPDKVSVPAALGPMVAYALTPQLDCDARRGTCESWGKDKREVTLPYPEIRDLPEDGRFIELEGSPEGTEYMFLRASTDPGKPPLKLPPVTMLVLSHAIEARAEAVDGRARLAVVRGGPQIPIDDPPPPLPPCCPPIIPGDEILVKILVDAGLARAAQPIAVNASLGLLKRIAEGPGPGLQ